MAKYKEVFTVRERTDRDGNKKNYWCRIGSAFDNKDGSLSVVLDALPLDGKLQIRTPEDRDDGDRGGGRRQQRGGGGDF